MKKEKKLMYLSLLIELIVGGAILYFYDWKLFMILFLLSWSKNLHIQWKFVDMFKKVLG